MSLEEPIKRGAASLTFQTQGQSKAKLLSLVGTYWQSFTIFSSRPNLEMICSDMQVLCAEFKGSNAPVIYFSFCDTVERYVVAVDLYVWLYQTKYWFIFKR